MPDLQPGRRLTAYFGESDRWQGKPLYLAVLEALRAQGVTGATVTRGVAGYGAHSRIHTARLVDVEPDLPIVVQAVDTAARVDAALDAIAAMVGEGVVTVEDIQLVRAERHIIPPLPADRRIADVMTTDVATVTPETPLAEVAQLLVQRDVKAVPVLDGERRVVGIVTGGDLLTRAGMQVRLSLQRELPDQLAAHHLRLLADSGRVARDVMTPHPLTVRTDAPLIDAAQVMAHQDIKRLPVVDQQGCLVGMVSRLDLLRVVARAAQETAAAPPPLGSGSRVEDVMLTDVPTARLTTPIDTALDQLVASPLRRVVVVDEAGRVQGLITDGSLLARTLPQPRGRVWASVRSALRLGDAPPAAPTNLTVGEVMDASVFVIDRRASILDAIQQMVERRVKRLVVVDDERRLVGMIDRQRALQAIADVNT